MQTLRRADVRLLCNWIVSFLNIQPCDSLTNTSIFLPWYNGLQWTRESWGTRNTILTRQLYPPLSPIFSSPTLQISKGTNTNTKRRNPRLWSLKSWDERGVKERRQKDCGQKPCWEGIMVVGAPHQPLLKVDLKLSRNCPEGKAHRIGVQNTSMKPCLLCSVWLLQ